MITIYAFVLGKSVSYARFVVSPGIFVAELQEKLVEKLNSLAGYSPDGFHLEFGPPGVQKPTSGLRAELDTFATLTAAGVVEGSRIVVVLPQGVPDQPPAAVAAAAPAAVGAPGIAAGDGSPGVRGGGGIRRNRPPRAPKMEEGEKSATSIILQNAGHTFEQDLAKVLPSELPSWLPWVKLVDGCDFSIRSDVFADPSCDIDVFSYISESSDGTLPLCSRTATHIRFVQFSKAAFPLNTWYETQFTPLDFVDSKGKSLTPEKSSREKIKYFVGEAYCGKNATSYAEKLEQIERDLLTLKKRWEARDSNRGEDVEIWRIVGLAALLLFTEKYPIKEADNALVIVRGAITSREESFPLLCQMMRANRFCIIMLDGRMCVSTSTTIATARQKLEIKEEMLEVIHENRERLLNALQAQQEAQRAQEERLLNAQQEAQRAQQERLLNALQAQQELLLDELRKSKKRVCSVQ